MADVTFKLDDKEFSAKLNKLTTCLDDFSKPLKKSAEELNDFYSNDVFESQGKDLGEKWKPLAPSTILARQMRKGYYKQPPITTNKILVWTGKLKSSFKSEVSRLKLRIFNIDNRFPFLQPDRPMLGINKKVETIVMDNLTEHLTIK